MTLHEQIKGEMKEAMKAKDTIKLSTIRNMLTAFTNESVAIGKTPQDFLDDEQTLAVIRRLAKQRKDSIEQFKAGGRGDLVGPEQAELAVLEHYLPQMMSREMIKPIVETKKADLQITDKARAGQLMAAVMAELKGKADGSDVKAVVDEMLS
jgi:hypothetical protein